MYEPNQIDYETENAICELKVSVSKQNLKQIELYMLLFKTDEAKLIDENGSPLAWMRRKKNNA